MRRRHSFATIVVGQRTLLREAVARILRSATLVSCADDLLCGQVQPGQTLFLIVHSGGDFDVLAQQIELLRVSHPDGRIAIVADRYRLNELLLAFRAGANGYLVDTTKCEVFIKSIELVMMGGTVLPSAFLSFVLGREGDQSDEASLREDNTGAILVTADDATVPQLSPREKLVLRYIIEGDCNKSIAQKLYIAEAAVRVHVKAILRKIRVHNRTQAAIWGMNNRCLVRTTGTNSPPLAPSMNKLLPSPVGASSEIEQTDRPKSPGVIEEANHAQVVRLYRLIRKGTTPKD
jgi:DNA-binding NarL/FixJ family response regulator